MCLSFLNTSMDVCYRMISRKKFLELLIEKAWKSLELSRTSGAGTLKLVRATACRSLRVFIESQCMLESQNVSPRPLIYYSFACVAVQRNWFDVLFWCNLALSQLLNISSRMALGRVQTSACAQQFTLVQSTNLTIKTWNVSKTVTHNFIHVTNL